MQKPAVYWVGKAWLEAFGWTLEGEVPKDRRYVLIAAPHTSNWDLPFTLAAGWVFGIEPRWLGKHTLFENKVFGAFMRKLGGIPVDRRARHDMVKSCVELFNGSKTLELIVPPEGTRSTVKNWKSGFYHIAKGAQVPIVLGYLDFDRKVAGLGPPFVPTGDLAADMDRIRAFYSGIRGKHPDRQSEPRLREEAAVLTPVATAPAGDEAVPPDLAAVTA